MTTITYGTTLGKHGITLPDDLIADVEVPILTGSQCQGDVGIFRRWSPVGKAELSTMIKVPADGVTIVQGINAHILDAYLGDVFWAAGDGGLLIGVVHVPEGSVAVLTHTDEHTSSGVGPGTYRVKGKREQAQEIQRVAD